MKKMYEPFQIGGAVIKNRLVASAMFEYGADNGRVTEKIVERYRELSEGGSGLIISGMQAVSASGAVAPLMVNTQYDGYVADMKKIADIVHANGGKLIVQLQHCGSHTFPMDGFDHFAVSETQVSENCAYHEATHTELRKVAADFGESASRCKESGADGVQIHGAHGYLINSFLSPSANHRTDEYGGNIENRARLLFEIYDSIREAVGEDYIVGVKFPFSDLNDASILPEESARVCRELEKKGMDFIEVSSGMVMDSSKASFTPVIRKGDGQGPFLKYAEQVANALTIPVISVCGYRTPDFIERTLTETKVSAVSFGRPLVREPNLPNRWREDESPAKCVSCNGCCNSFGDGIITCQVDKRLKQKAT